MNHPDSSITNPVQQGLDLSRIRAITLDLDDTLWPIWPTIERAEAALQGWLETQAPATAALSRDPTVMRKVREGLANERPDLAHDLTALRREAIRRVLLLGGDDPTLAQGAFEVFFAVRHQVELFEDAAPMLDFLSSRYPIVALSNGNADVHRVGIGAHFAASISSREFGVGKPDPRIFHAAASAAQVQANEVLHIGDDAHLDGVGALNAGMQVAWLNRAGVDWPHAPLMPHLVVRDLHALCRALGA